VTNIVEDLMRSITRHIESGVDIQESRLGGESQTVDLWIAPTGQENAAPFEVVVGSDGIVLSIGTLIQLEIDPNDPEARDLVLDMFWANAAGGSAIYRIGWRRYFIAGDHPRLAREVASTLKAQRPNLVAEMSAWVLDNSTRWPRQFNASHLVHRM
jgi:hypothetical protein